VILAVTFIFSGFTKVVDPWGTAIKINEYLAVYDMEWFKPASMIFAIWLCGAEMMMGCMLLFKVRIRLISIFAFVAMIFFTSLTLLSATLIPVEDCGCFGEAIKLTAWQTFFKNLILLPLAALLWAYTRSKEQKIFAFNLREIFFTIFFFVLTMGMGAYCYLHLPLIDFLPYKKGVNIEEAMYAGQTVPDGELETVLVYKHKKTGKLREFSIDDDAWQDESKWEWVETKVLDEIPVEHSLIEEFALRNRDGEDMTNVVIGTRGRLYMICITDIDRIGRRCMERLHSLVERAAQEGACVICLTPQPLQGFPDTFGVPYNIDGATMKTMLRAETGVVILDNGTITDKLNCRDI
jgi:hypothetical protein